LRHVASGLLLGLAPGAWSPSHAGTAADGRPRGTTPHGHAVAFARHTSGSSPGTGSGGGGGGGGSLPHSASADARHVCGVADDRDGAAAVTTLSLAPGGAPLPTGVGAGAGAAVAGSGHMSSVTASAGAAPPVVQLLGAGPHTASQGSLPVSGAAQVPGLLAPGLPHVGSFLSLPGTPLSGSLPGSLSMPSLGAGPAGQQHALASAGHVLSALPPALNGAPGQSAHVVAASAPASTGVPGSQP